MNFKKQANKIVRAARKNNGQVSLATVLAVSTEGRFVDTVMSRVQKSNARKGAKIQLKLVR